MDYCFSAKNPGFPRKCGRKFLAHQVVVYLKPPGSLQYVEKCLTETVYRETNPKFSTKVSQFWEKLCMCMRVCLAHMRMQIRTLHTSAFASKEYEMKK